MARKSASTEPKKRNFAFTPACFDIPALAHYLSITNNHAEELVRSGTIPSRLEGSRKVVDRADADAWNARRTEIEALKWEPALSDEQSQAFFEDVERDEDGM